MELYYKNINMNLSKIFSIIIIFQIFKAETTQESRITRIIYVGDIYYRYMSFASYSNGDMVVEATMHPENHGRKFYGLKANGRPFFKDKSTNKETPYYSIDVTNDNYRKFEHVGIIIKLSNNENNGKEYFFSISKLECNAELFDFDNDKVYTKTVDSFTTLRSLNSLRSALFPLSSSSQNLEYYYFFGFSAINQQNTDQDPHKFFLQKHKFESLIGFEYTKTFTDQYILSDEDTFGLQTSCFQTVNGLINCFYSSKNSNNDIYYIIAKYTIELTDKQVFSFQANINDEKSFLKCIHLKDDVGVYAYYLYQEGSFYPVFLFKKFKSNSFIDYLPNIEITSHNFLNNLLMNDLIKLTENSIVFSSVVEGKNIVYIILINIFGDKKK